MINKISYIFFCGLYLCAPSVFGGEGDLKDKLFSGREALNKYFLLYLKESGEKRLIEDESISFNDSKLISKCLAEFGDIDIPPEISKKDVSINLYKAKNNNMVTISTVKIDGWGLRCFINNDLEILDIH